MDLQKVDSLEKTVDEIRPIETTTYDALPANFYDQFVLRGIKIDSVEPGRVLCSMTNSENFLHGGATASLVDLVGSAAFYTVGTVTGTTLEISTSYLDSASPDDMKFNCEGYKSQRRTVMP